MARGCLSVYARASASSCCATSLVLYWSSVLLIFYKFLAGKQNLCQTIQKK